MYANEFKTVTTHDVRATDLQSETIWDALLVNMQLEKNDLVRLTDVDSKFDSAFVVTDIFMGHCSRSLLWLNEHGG